METLKADYRFFVYANKTTKQFIINRAEGYKRDGKWTLTYWITVKMQKNLHMSEKSKQIFVVPSARPYK